MALKPVIYLIDDDEVNCFLVTNVVREIYPGSEIVCFHAADDALQKLKQVHKDLGNYPGLILLELYLKEKDGWAFLEEYSALLNNSFNLPNNSLTKCEVVILTCSMFPNDTERARGYECVAGFIEKPFTEEAITENLNKLFCKNMCQ